MSVDGNNFIDNNFCSFKFLKEVYKNSKKNELSKEDKNQIYIKIDSILKNSFFNRDERFSSEEINRFEIKESSDLTADIEKLVESIFDEINPHRLINFNEIERTTSSSSTKPSPPKLTPNQDTIKPVAVTKGKQSLFSKRVPVATTRPPIIEQKLDLLVELEDCFSDEKNKLIEKIKKNNQLACLISIFMKGMNVIEENQLIEIAEILVDKQPAALACFINEFSSLNSTYLLDLLKKIANKSKIDSIDVSFFDRFNPDECYQIADEAISNHFINQSMFVFSHLSEFKLTNEEKIICLFDKHINKNGFDQILNMFKEKKIKDEEMTKEECFLYRLCLSKCAEKSPHELLSYLSNDHYAIDEEFNYQILKKASKEIPDLVIKHINKIEIENKTFLFDLLKECSLKEAKEVMNYLENLLEKGNSVVKEGFDFDLLLRCAPRLSKEVIAFSSKLTSLNDEQLTEIVKVCAKKNSSMAIQHIKTYFRHNTPLCQRLIEECNKTVLNEVKIEDLNQTAEWTVLSDSCLKERKISLIRLDMLGKGGIGEVYLSKIKMINELFSSTLSNQPPLSQDEEEVAVKFIHSHKFSLERNPFFNNAIYNKLNEIDQTEQNLKAKNTLLLPKFIHLSEEKPFIVFDLMKGGSIQQKINEIASLPKKTKEKFILQAAEDLFSGINLLHNHDLIASDRKPSNVLLEKADFTSDHPCRIRHADLDGLITKEAWQKKGGQCHLVTRTVGYTFAKMMEVISEEKSNTRQADHQEQKWDLLKQNDVYGTATVIYAMLTGSSAAKDSGDVCSILPLIDTEKQTYRDSIILTALAELTNRIVHEEAEKGPISSASDVLEAIVKIKEANSP